MKKLIAKIIVRFKTFYFVSGTFEHQGERKWFRIIYIPKNGYVNEKEVEEIFQKETGLVSAYFVITNFRKTNYKQYLNF